MSQLFDKEFLTKLQRLSLKSKFSIDTLSAGNRKSRSKGSSVEFSDYREYSHGDDFRRLDWNAYGRFEKLYIKLFMEEREAPVTIILDVSKSMDWGEPNKTISSRRLAAALAYISLVNYDRVSIMCADEKIQKSCTNVRGKNFFHKITDILENVHYNAGSNIQKAIESFPVKWSKGITVLISDLFTDGEFDELLKYLTYHKQTVYICHILSPQEISPVINESIRLVDSETGEFVDITVTKGLIDSYYKTLGSFRSSIEKSCRNWGAYYFQFSSKLTVDIMVKEVAEH